MDALVIPLVADSAITSSGAIGSAARFEPWGPAHITVLLFTVLGAAILVRWGRRLRDTRSAQTVSRLFAVILLTLTVVFQLYWFLPAHFVLDQSLPFHLSDILRLIAAYALWTQRPWAVAVTFYWGLTLNLQSMLTPDLNPHSSYLIEFSSYWSLHVLVMWAPIFLTWGLGLKPSSRGYATTLGITVTWAVVVFALNLLLGTNYGYLNGKPAAASILDVLGPWPMYLLVELGAVIIIWALLTLLFRNRGPSAPSPQSAGSTAPGTATGPPHPPELPR